MSDAAPHGGRHGLAPLLDAFFFAPIGLAVLVAQQFPRLVEMGRQQAETQVKVARMVGEFAVTLGRRELAKRLRGERAPQTPTGEPTPTPSSGPALTSVATFRPVCVAI